MHICQSWILSVLVVFCVFSITEAESLPVGINLSHVSYWSSEYPFKDLFKQSQPWKSQQKNMGYGMGAPLSLSPGGWVTELLPDQFSDSIVCRNAAHYSGGEYVCLYDGSGTIELKGDAVVTSRSEGRILFEVLPSDNGMILVLKETQSFDPVRNIRIMPREFEQSYATEPFHPKFLDRWAGFKVIRFMDWMETNNSRVRTWDQRTQPLMQTQGGANGVALEHMIQLANILHADPWFCMPHLADDDYVRNFAMMVKKLLDPDLKIYVEYTNEAWNYTFDQAVYCQEQGLDLGLSDNPFKAGLYYYSKRSLEIFRIWEDTVPREKLVRVLSSQFKNSWTSKKILNYKDAGQYADALAVAPYFGNALGKPDRTDEVASMTVSQILNACVQDIEENHGITASHAKISGKFGLDLIAYEGGQHLVGVGGAENDELLTFLFKKANRHPRMKELYMKDLDNWKNAGGKLFTAFASMGHYNKWGSWGLLEHVDQNLKSAPKYQAVKAFIENRHENQD